MLLLPSNLLLGLLWLTGCQEPFDRDRHDLVGLRIAAVTAEVDDDHVAPRIALVVDGRPWSRTAANVDWFWIEEPGESVDRASGSLGVGFGPAPSLALPDDGADDDASDATDGARLAVLVELDGQVRRAELVVSGLEATTRRSPVELRTQVVPLDVESVDGASMGLEERRELQARSARTVDPGGFARFDVTADGGEAGLQTRFMATRHAAAGTFFELDATTTDWVAGELVLDDDEVETREVGPTGALTVLGLAIGEGRSGLGVADFFVGDVPDGVWTHGRFLSTDQAAPDAEALRGTLVADDDAPTGLGLVDLRPEAPSDPVFDASQLPCTNVVGDAFDPTWLLEQRCVRDDLLGIEVRIHPDVP